MNILVISQHYYPENFRITDICETLVKKGHNVTVICGYPNYPEGYINPDYKGKGKKKHKNEEINGVKIHRCFEIARGHSAIKLFLNYYSVCLSMKRKAKKIKEKFDCVFVNETSPVMVGWAGIAYAKKHKVPCVLYCYDIWPDSLAAGGIKKGSFAYKHYFKVSKRIYNCVDKVLCTSKNFINHLSNVHGVKEDNLGYLPQYCEDLFDNEMIKAASNKDTYDYVFAGNVGKVQSVETIIKAANEIKNDESIKIHIVGDGSNLENCKKMVGEYQLKNVIFYGKHPIEDMPKFYAMADAMIVTLSKEEIISKTLPGKVQSYMCSGKPIIAAIDGETPMILDEAKCGLCTNSENYIGLAQLFVKFKSVNKEDLARNSKSYYDKNFRKELFFDNLVEIMEEMIK